MAVLRQVDNRGTVTLPLEMRQGLDLVSIEQRPDGVIELRPQVAVDKAQAWFCNSGPARHSWPSSPPTDGHRGRAAGFRQSRLEGPGSGDPGSGAPVERLADAADELNVLSSTAQELLKKNQRQPPSPVAPQPRPRQPSDLRRLVRIGATNCPSTRRAPNLIRPGGAVGKRLLADRAGGAHQGHDLPRRVRWPGARATAAAKHSGHAGRVGEDREELAP